MGLISYWNIEKVNSILTVQDSKNALKYIKAVIKKAVLTPEEKKALILSRGLHEDFIKIAEIYKSDYFRKHRELEKFKAEKIDLLPVCPVIFGTIKIKGSGLI